jgi:dienelactone hydrolase
MHRFAAATIATLLLLPLPACGPAAAQSVDADRDEAAAGTAGPQGPEQHPGRRQLWLLPLRGQSMLMRATLLRPEGMGPFPLVVINHGSVQNADRRAKFRMPEYRVAARWFLDRGYAVLLPQRPGHGETGGPYLENQGGCDDPDFHAAGLATADSIQSAIDYMTSQLFIRRTGVVVVGQSAGGWGALALASRNPGSVKAVINVAGGRGGRAGGKANRNCAPDRLVSAAQRFGATARIPTLWFYSENDSYFAPWLAQRMVEAFRNAGGRAEYHRLPPIGEDGHRFISMDEAVLLWAPTVEKWLAAR